MATTTGGITDGIIDWSWGGYSTLSEKSTDTWQLDGIKDSINYIRSKGGDVIISIGGLNEGNFFQVTQDEEVLFNSYMDVIQGYGLTRLDLDIEGGGQGKQKNIANAKALKRVQDATGVEIVLTLPVLPSGLTDLGLGTMEAYIENGVDVKMVNIMAMCYGNATILPGETYATASVRAIDNTAQQIYNTYKNNGKTISTTESYEKVGVTVSIGEESASFPIWTTAYSQVVNEKAIQANIGMTSFWCLNRDCQKYGANAGIYGMYEHTNVFKTFMGDNAYQIPDVGSDGEYEEGGQVIKEWKKGSVYFEGDKVIYDGKVWQALWWTQGDTPGVPAANGAEPWKYVKDVEESEKPTEKPTEQPTTEAPTTEPITEKNEVVVGIDGCQVSATAEGYRVIYTVKDSDKKAAKVGLVYGLADKSSPSDMIVGSTNSTVHAYEATDEGKISSSITGNTEAQSYAMTMKLIKTAEFYRQPIYVRAYVQLDDGSYVYSDIQTYNVYEVAEYLYQNKLMTNMFAHNYLYSEILSVVNPDYTKVIFNINDTIVK